MKKWTLPTIEELDLKYTAAAYVENETSGETESQEDLARCPDGGDYWKPTDSNAENPFWGGSHEGWQGGWGN